MNFKERNTHFLKLWLLKIDFLYKISKHEHFNGKNNHPTEL